MWNLSGWWYNRCRSFTIWMKGPVAQLVSASAWHAEGQGFESPQVHRTWLDAPIPSCQNNPSNLHCNAVQISGVISTEGYLTSRAKIYFCLVSLVFPAFSGASSNSLVTATATTGLSLLSFIKMTPWVGLVSVGIDLLLIGSLIVWPSLVLMTTSLLLSLKIRAEATLPVFLVISETLTPRPERFWTG